MSLGGRKDVVGPRFLWSACAPAALLLAVGCDGGGEQAAPAVRSSTQRRTPVDLTPLGAAQWLPANAAYFAAAYGLGDLFEDIADSRALRSVLRLPGVARGLAELERELAVPVAQLRAHPLLDELCEVLLGGASRELFVCAGSSWVPFTDALATVYREAFVQELRAQAHGGIWSPEGTESLVRTVLRLADDLRMPQLTLGCRLAEPGTVGPLLGELTQLLGYRMPAEWQSMNVGGTEYSVAVFEPGMFPGWQRQLRFALRRVPNSLAQRLLGFVETQRLHVALGVRGDHLVLHLGSDLRQLESLGGKRSLARSPAFAGLRERLDDSLLSVTYVSERMRGGGIAVDRWMRYLGDVLPAAPLVETSGHDLRGDLRRLLEEINDSAPEPEPFVGASFRRRGIETWEFGGRSGGDASRPLGLLATTGPDALLRVAQRLPAMAESWRRAARWFGVAHGYFERLVVPQMQPGDRAAFARLTEIAAPALRELDSVLSDLVLPAVEGGEALLVLDRGGVMDRVPGIPGRIKRPLELPLPALVWDVSDTRSLVTGFARLRDAANALAQRAAELEGFPAPDPLPAPAVEETGTGTVYSYAVPPDAPSWLVPHARVTSDRVVVALSLAMSEALAAGGRALPESRVAFDAPASSAAWVDCESIVDLMHDATDTVLRRMVWVGELPRAEGLAYSAYADGIAGLLRSIRSFSSRCFRESGTEVRHSWLHVEDL